MNKLGQYRTASEGTPVLAASNFDNAKSTNGLRNSGDGGNGNSSDRKRSVLGGLFNKPSGGGLLGLRKGSDKDRSGSSASIVQEDLSHLPDTFDRSTVVRNPTDNCMLCDANS